MEDQIRGNVGRSTWLTYIERETERERKRGREGAPLSVFVLSSFLAVRRSRVTKKKLYPILPRPVFSAITIYLSLSARWKTRRMLAPSTWTVKCFRYVEPRRSSILAKRSMVFERDDWHREKTKRLLVTRCVADRGIEIATSSTCSDRDAGNT